MFATFASDADARLIAVAVHDGHDLRDGLTEMMVLGDRTRTREEDPHTGDWARLFPMHVIVHRSRFEVDLNRERENAIYVTPEDAWDLELWREGLSGPVVERSLDLYDRFYSEMRETLDGMVMRHGGFVLFDIHSYNHRRQGPNRPPEPQADNPTVNLGTGSMRHRWRPVAEAFLNSVRAQTVDDESVDARENVRFRGRAVAAFVDEHYGDVACALAIEVKKIYMDEWTGRLDGKIHRQFGNILKEAGDEATRAWSDIAGH